MTVRKLSWQMKRSLRSIATYGHPYRGVHGLAEHGGLGQVILALQRRGLIERTRAREDDGRQHAGWALTEAGQAVLDDK